MSAASTASELQNQAGQFFGPDFLSEDISESSEEEEVKSSSEDTNPMDDNEPRMTAQEKVDFRKSQLA